MGIATKTDSPVKSIADLKGKTVGYLSGSTGEKWVKDNQAADGFADVKGYKAYPDMLLDLSAGRVDAVISDIPGMQYAFKTMTGLTVKDRIKTGEQYGLMLPKDDPNLRKLSDAHRFDEDRRGAGRDPQEMVRRRAAGGFVDRDAGADPEVSARRLPRLRWGGAWRTNDQRRAHHPAQPSGSRRRSLLPGDRNGSRLAIKGLSA